MKTHEGGWINIKTCVTCKESKSLSEYYPQNKKKADGTHYIYYGNECKVCVKIRSTKWGENNRERKREHWRKYSKLPHKRETQARISKEVRESGKYLEWQRNNKNKIAGYTLSRANKIHNITAREWENCKEYFNHSCAYCGLHIDEHYNRYKGELKLTDLHKEHVEHEGSNDITNCVPSCKSCNSSKHIFKLEDWYTPDNPNYSEERLNLIYKWIHKDVYSIQWNKEFKGGINKIDQETSY